MRDTKLLHVQPKVYGLALDDSAPVLVMLAGLPDSHEMWSHQVQRFGDTHHMVSITTPDFDQPKLRRPEGYRFDEVLAMIARAIDTHLGKDRTFVLMGHDWGAVWAYMYAVDRGHRIEKLITIDVGCVTDPDNETTRGQLWALPYQLCFATIFWLGLRVSAGLASLLLRLFLAVARVVGPFKFSYRWHTSPRPLSEWRWWHTYPVYYLWRHAILGGEGLPTMTLPDCPVLYSFGENKRAFFHTEEFVERVRDDPRSAVKVYPGAHWLMHENALDFNEDLAAFLGV